MSFQHEHFPESRKCKRAKPAFRRSNPISRGERVIDRYTRAELIVIDADDQTLWVHRADFGRGYQSVFTLTRGEVRRPNRYELIAEREEVAA